MAKLNPPHAVRPVRLAPAPALGLAVVHIDPVAAIQRAAQDRARIAVRFPERHPEDILDVIADAAAGDMAKTRARTWTGLNAKAAMFRHWLGREIPDLSPEQEASIGWRLLMSIVDDLDPPARVDGGR